MKTFDRAHTIQASLWPRSISAIKSFSTQLTHSSYHTNDRMRHSTREIELVIFNGGRPNLGRIPSTSAERKRQILAQSTHQEETFKEGDLVLLCDNKSFQHPRKIRMHWLEPYEVKSIKDGGVV
jgi:hypothetical protein